MPRRANDDVIQDFQLEQLASADVPPETANQPNPEVRGDLPELFSTSEFGMLRF